MRDKENMEIDCERNAVLDDLALVFKNTFNLLRLIILQHGQFCFKSVVKSVNYLSVVEKWLVQC